MGALERRRQRARQLLGAALASLVHATGGGSVLLKGVTRNGLVSSGAAKFYKLQLACPDTAQALQLSLTALEGNPDLYVSASVQQPGPDSYTWSASAPGSDALQLEYPDAGVYYLGVFGATAAAFKLQARVTLTTGARRALPCARPRVERRRRQLTAACGCTAGARLPARRRRQPTVSRLPAAGR